MRLDNFLQVGVLLILFAIVVFFLDYPEYYTRVSVIAEGIQVFEGAPIGNHVLFSDQRLSFFLFDYYSNPKKVCNSFGFLKGGISEIKPANENGWYKGQSAYMRINCSERKVV